MPRGKHVDSWLDEYTRPHSVRRHASADIWSARSLRDGTQRVVVTGPVDGPQPAIAKRFDAIAKAHKAVGHSRLPTLKERGRRDGLEYIGFACSGVADGRHVVRELARREERLTLAALLALTAGLLDALGEAHRAPPGSSGQRLFVGSISHSNLLFSLEGDYWLLGLGANFVTTLESGAPSEDAGFRSMSVAAGAPPSAESDFTAVLLLAHALMPYVDIPNELREALSGTSKPGSGALQSVSRWLHCPSAISARSTQRAPSDARSRLAEFARYFAVEPDHEDLAATIRRILIVSQGAHDEAGRSRPLFVADDGRFFRTQDGRSVDLEAHPSLRRMMVALSEAAISSPGARLTLNELLEAGWPGESVAAAPGANRVYVAISALRRHGLRGVLENKSGGYRLVGPVKRLAKP